ncbi:MAG: hypothetical protein RL260_2738 [Pseudomonadota bacterium]
MTTIAEFVPFVAVKVAKDMPTQNIQHAIRETLVFFLEQTRAAIDETYVLANCNEAELLVPVPPCHRLVGIDGVYEVPKQLGLTGQIRWRPDWTVVPFGDWHLDEADGNLTTLWVAPQVHARRFAIRYSWTPKRSATCEVPEWVFERFVDAIADGALAYLHSNAADEGASDRFAAMSAKGFKMAIDEVKRRKAAQYGPREMTVSSRHFFRG